jgi:type III secretion HrpO family protein
MDVSQILDLSVKAVILILVLSLPSIAVATIVGVLISLIQALTQVQEQTLGFAVKLIAVGLTLLATAVWMGSELLQYTGNILESFPRMAK